VKPQLTLIAAMDENRLLATAHGIPWRLPRDIAHFRNHTRDKWLLLGRHSFNEMRGWFRAGHTPLVLSSSCGYDPGIGRVVASVPHALALAESAGQTEVVCCGGAQTYAAALPYATQLLLSIVKHKFPAEPGAVYFPEWNDGEWIALSADHHPADAENVHPIRIVRFQRKTQPAA
jgi:dihydrofolate reductase